MKDLYMIVDIDRCWGCTNCVVACQMVHQLPPETSFLEVVKNECEDQGRVYIDCAPMMCLHCTDAACEKACAQHAISHDEEGTVIVDESRCVGCGLCAKACSYGAIAMLENKARKCDLCKERRSRNFLPSCEQHCSGHALTSCDWETAQTYMKGKRSWTCGHVIYVSERLTSLGEGLK